MTRRSFMAASGAAALSAFVLGFGGEVGDARKRRRNRGGSAFARAAITGTGGRVSVSVNCGSGRFSSAETGPPSHGGNDDGTAVSARC